MTQELGNKITIQGKQETSFFRCKYLSFEEVKAYTGLGQETEGLLKEFSVSPVLKKGKEKYLKSEIDKMMFKHAS